jgi:hypothetical protein
MADAMAIAAEAPQIVKPHAAITAIWLSNFKIFVEH